MAPLAMLGRQCEALILSDMIAIPQAFNLGKAPKAAAKALKDVTAAQRGGWLEDIGETIRRHDVHAIHVPAHAGVPGNESVHGLADRRRKDFFLARPSARPSATFRCTLHVVAWRPWQDAEDETFWAATMESRDGRYADVSGWVPACAPGEGMFRAVRTCLAILPEGSRLVVHMSDDAAWRAILAHVPTKDRHGCGLVRDRAVAPERLVRECVRLAHESGASCLVNGPRYGGSLPLPGNALAVELKRNGHRKDEVLWAKGKELAKTVAPPVALEGILFPPEDLPPRTFIGRSGIRPIDAERDLIPLAKAMIDDAYALGVQVAASGKSASPGILAGHMAFAKMARETYGLKSLWSLLSDAASRAYCLGRENVQNGRQRSPGSLLAKTAARLREIEKSTRTLVENARKDTGADTEGVEGIAVGGEG
jgi:hypothetical protein